jgi:hypothetical protein
VIREERDTRAGEKESLRPRVSLVLVFIVLAFVAYSTVLDSYFLSDDFAQIGKILEGDWSVTWAQETGGFFRPLFILSYIVDARLWRENPLGYHLTNTLLHAVNSLLVYHTARKLLEAQEPPAKRAQAVSLVAGLLFLLHPSHTENVSWISGRADLLATTLCLAAVLSFISYLEARRLLAFILSLVAFALALLAKESAASLPLVLLALWLYLAPGRKQKAELWGAAKTSAPFFIVLFLFIIARRAALGVWLGGYGAGQHLNFSPGWIRDRFLQAALRSLVPALPQGLSAIFLKPLQSPVFIIAALLCLALVALLLRRRARLEDAAVRREQNKLLLLLVAAFILSLLPVINLRLSLFDTQGERFLYWPSVFSCILVACLAFALLRSMKWWLALMLCVLVFYSVSLYRTNQTWREAAYLSRSIRDELARDAPAAKSLVVVNAPDNLRGVPVFHNGLEEALRIFRPRARGERVSVLALHDIQSLSDEVELKREGDVYSLRLYNRATVFASITDRLDCLEIPDRSSQAFHFRLSSCADSPALFFFNAGRMYRVIDE